MSENNRKSIEKCRKKLPQFTTMNVIDGQAGLVIYSSLIFYSLTIDNILNIIVLLILAGVSIAMLTGDNGILTQAQNAKEQNIIGKEKEVISLAYTACRAKDIEKIVSNAELQAELEKNKENVQVDMSGDDLIIWFKDTGHRYKINQNGELEQIENLSPEEANKIVDMLDTNIGITARGEVVYIEGELARNQFEILNTDNRISITKGIKKTGKNFILDNAGKIYTWGKNYYGQLGDGTTEDRNIPMCISDLENELKGKVIKEIYSGDTIIAIDNEGKVYTWGYNGYGQLGDETTENRSMPICISNLDNELKGRKIEKVYCGYKTVIAIDNEGKVYTWGDNEYGQLGDGTTKDRNIPMCISDLDNELKGRKIEKVYCGYKTVIVIDNEGKVYTWGDNEYGQLGDGTTKDRNIPMCISDLDNELKGKVIKEIYGGDTIIAIDNEGKVYTWGYNRYGQLGNETTENRSMPICISNLDNDLKGKQIKEIYDGYDGNTIIAIDNEGKIYTWGKNYYGQLGDGTSEDRNIPICISNLENELRGKNVEEIYWYNRSIRVLDNMGNLYTWGDNEYGQLGDKTSEYINTPICLTNNKNNKLYNKNLNKIYYLDAPGESKQYCAYITKEGEIIYYLYYQLV